jgi:septal ring factor EnvC (AmiA/AmiB activator)
VLLPCCTGCRCRREDERLTFGIGDTGFGRTAPPYFTRSARMAGAPDPGIAAALEAQSKSLDAQSRTLATQSKLLQQLCDRLESQDHRWSNLEKVVSANADNIAVLQAKLEDGGD